ncbi:MAG: IS66 family transposase [Syntrophomonas sp.]|nr:IS66 family transposase [Syntrophomonas sp.]
MEKLDGTGLSPDVTEYISSLEKQVESQKMRIDQLMDILAKSQKAMYGQSSEKSRYVLGEESDQVSLFNEAEAETNSKAAEPTAETLIPEHVRKAKRTKEELAETLPVVEIICDIPEEQQICNICESKLRYLGKEHVRDELEIIPAQLRVLRYIRYNYVCEKCEAETNEANIIKASVPAPVMKRSLASPSSVAHVMYQKYVNAMPLYRQEKDWANQGVILSRATLANWIIRSSNDWLKPICNVMKDHLLNQSVIHADETVIQVLKEEGKKPTSESRMWVYCTGNTGSPPAILFDYQPTRSGNHAKRYLNGFKGYLQTDGYSGYDAVPDVIRCGCYAHLRRKYEEAMPKTGDHTDSKAAIGFNYCNQLFDLEKQWLEYSPEERLKKRQEQSKPVLDAYWSWLESVNPLQGSNLGKAVAYSINQKDTLNAFLLNGCIEISNNRAENAIRPYVTGRKNWLFSDTQRGAESSAVVYSIIESAKANGLNPYMYLVHLFTQLPKLKEMTSETLKSFLPWSAELPVWCKNNID